MGKRLSAQSVTETWFYQTPANFFEINGMFGTPNWPLTQTLVELITGVFSLMTIIIITYYTAEVVWRERTVGRMGSHGNRQGDTTVDIEDYIIRLEQGESQHERLRQCCQPIFQKDRVIFRQTPKWRMLWPTYRMDRYALAVSRMRSHPDIVIAIGFSR